MKMNLRNSLKTEKAKERYDRNYDSVEITFTQKELKEHDKEVRNKTLDVIMEELQEVIDEHGTQYVMMYMKERVKQLKR